MIVRAFRALDARKRLGVEPETVLRVGEFDQRSRTWGWAETMDGEYLGGCIRIPPAGHRQQRRTTATKWMQAARR